MRYLLAFALLVASPAVFAHHPLAGQEMTTLWHGVLSGLGHPLLGFDHLFFVLLVGVTALFTGSPRIAPLAYIATMLAGCVAVTFGLAVPGVEVAVAMTLLALGAAGLSGKRLSILPACGLFAIAGAFHGAAFGASMASAEASALGVVLFGYLVGLGVIQYALCIGAGYAMTRIWGALEADAMPARLAGATVAGVGLFLSLEHLEGAAFAALGVG